MSYLRTQITGRIQTMLQSISPDNDYRTSIGRLVQVGLLRGNPEDVPCLFLVPGAELAASEYGVTRTEAVYTISAFVNRLDTTITGYAAAPRANWVIADAMIADVRQVMEGRDTALEALIESLTYEGAKPLYEEGAGERLGVELRYSIRFAMARGDPDNQPS